MKPNQLVSLVCLLLALVLVAVDGNYLPEFMPVPTPPTTLHAVIVEESGDRQDNPDLAIVLASMEVRALFGEFRLIDPDTPVHADLQPYIDRATSLPTLFLVDSAGKLWYEGDVPLTVDGWRELVRGIKQ